MTSADKDQKEANATVATSAQTSHSADVGGASVALSVSESAQAPRLSSDEHAFERAPDHHASDDAADLIGDRHIYGHLGRKLKESYDDLVRQPVPDKFRKLLEELERKEKGQ